MEVARPQLLSPCSSVGNSPEFEFWMVRNNNKRNSGFHQPENLLTADELFVDGFLLPLHRLHLQQQPSKANPPLPPPPPYISELPPPPPAAPPASTAESVGPELSSAANDPNRTSKRWKDMFKKSDKKKEHVKKVKVVNCQSSGGLPTASSELNIKKMWPFSRSRSDGDDGSRNRPVGTRKVSSAPCSRSNSKGDSKSSKKWPSSPSRGGVHLGRSSPVWQMRRSCSSAKPSPKSNPTGGKVKVLNLNVPTCIGYKQHLSCKSDGSSFIVSRVGSKRSGGDKHIGGGNGGRYTAGGVGGGGVTSTFNLRSLFTMKIH